MNAPGGESGMTPLHRAASEGHVETIRLLLDRGADINARGTVAALGATAVQVSAVRGHPEAVKLLVEVTRRLDQETVEGLTRYEV